MKIKVIMSDKAMTRETMDQRELMLKEAVSSECEISVDCIKKGPDELDCNTDEAFAAAASMLCNRFTVLISESVNIPRTYRRLWKNAIARDKMAAVRALDIPIGELRKDAKATEKYLKSVCEAAVKEAHADGIILGCLSMAGYGKQLEAELPIKVIDPAFLSIAYAELCARLHLAHVEEVYPKFMNNSNVEI